MISTSPIEAREVDLLVTDPFEVYPLWKSSAEENTNIFEEVFTCYPTNQTKTWSEVSRLDISCIRARSADLVWIVRGLR